jgi:hypothetical protein
MLNRLMAASVAKHYSIVFQSRGTKPRHRYFICVNSLVSVIGIDNANSAFLRALNSPDDKIRVKLRKFGIIDFYSK